MSQHSLGEFARKKQVPQHYNPNSFRIFDEDIKENTTKSINSNNIERSKGVPSTSLITHSSNTKEKRHVPHTNNTTLITDNVRYLKQPIHAMETPLMNNNQHWWPNNHIIEPKQPKIKYTINTTQRQSFGGIDNEKIDDIHRGRHGSNPNVLPASGIVPSNIRSSNPNGPQKVKERISFQHNCNSRGSEPIRGKRHGAFIWDPIVLNEKGQEIFDVPWNDRNVQKQKQQQKQQDKPITTKIQQIATQEQEEKTTKN